MHTIYLALGTNLGDKHALMLEAIDQINKKIGTILCQSSFYETEPWGFVSNNTFLNACVKVEMGRTKKSVDGHYSDRPMDIDILFYDDLHINTPQLIIPHPKMLEREFVMKPLSEIRIE